MYIKNLRNLPAALCEGNGDYKFCCWKYVNDKGSSKKVPYNPITGKRASPTDPSTFGSIDDIQKAGKQYDGIGVMITGNLGAIDLDHCVADNGNSGKELSEKAQNIIKIMDSYTEYSPHGDGIHIFFTVPKEMYYDTSKYKIKNGDIEVYIAGVTGRYMTLTGDVLTPGKDLAERGDEVMTILDKYMKDETRVKKKTKRNETEDKTDNTQKDEHDEINDEDVSKILMSGDTKLVRLFTVGYSASSYASESEADLALCEKLAYWTGNDPQKIDKFFRMSALYREKWERQDYRDHTIQKAIEYCGMSAKQQVGVRECPARLKTEPEPISPASLTKETDLSSSADKVLTSKKEFDENIPTLTDTSKFTTYNACKYIEQGQHSRDNAYFEKYKNRKMGFANIDRYLTLYPGLAAIGGTASVGKSTFCVNLADNLVESGETILYFALEQEAVELVNKSLTRRLYLEDSLHCLTNTDIKNGGTSDTFESVKYEYAKDSDHLYIIHCNFNITAKDIRNYVETFISATGIIPVVFVDYLQLLSPPPNFRGDTRAGIDHNIKVFKDMQRRNELLIILISSFNRNAYDKSTISYADFKETGLIEFSCDYVWGLRTPEDENGIITNNGFSDLVRDIEFISLKNRNGRQEFKCRFEYHVEYDYFKPI